MKKFSLLIAPAFFLLAASARAISLGQVDTFFDGPGGNMNWINGASPVSVTNPGGPHGVGHASRPGVPAATPPRPPPAPSRGQVTAGGRAPDMDEVRAETAKAKPTEAPS